jgi:hypothetical protein
MSPESAPQKKEEVDLLSDVISCLEKKDGSEQLAFLLKDVNHNETKKRELAYAFNFRSANWNYFSYLESEQIPEMVYLLREFMSETDREKATLKAREITEKLN